MLHLGCRTAPKRSLMWFNLEMTKLSLDEAWLRAWKLIIAPGEPVRCLYWGNDYLVRCSRGLARHAEFGIIEVLDSVLTEHM